jgi:hypothetical protein
MSELRRILERLEWWRLVPAPDGFIGAGAGTGIDRAAAALSNDGSRALLYVPSVRPVTIDTRFLGAAIRGARWIDPTDGESTAAEMATTPTGTATFVAPGRNRGQGRDWLLVIDTLLGVPNDAAGATEIGTSNLNTTLTK